MPPKLAAALAFTTTLLSLSALGTPAPVRAATSPAVPPAATANTPEEAPADAYSKPLITAVTRMAGQSTVTARDYSELAQTTITYGQRLKSAQQRAPEKTIKDALEAVDAGEKIDEKIAEWPKLRQELQELLKKEEPPPQDQKKKDEDKKDQQKQDQQKNQQQNQDKNQSNDPNKEKSDQQKQDEQKQQQQDESQKQQKQNQQNAFGDMKDKQEEKAQPKPQPPPSGTQKVGGQQDKKSDEQKDPELALPLQKLEQVRNQDSPAKLQQIMQGQQQQKKPGTPGKDW